ncbi:Mur ligase domain-containing protein [Exiguobacterium sp. SL14]|nr:Mur ligase domain-containing protein [Exiguobacterium sp. SL14]MCY1690646.1 Mur ligase domain-containing protein [Exiguobacterium sp. SL14]
MNLAELIQVIQTQKIERMVEVDVTSITTDSRDVKPGTLFVAIKGYTVDGHDYAKQAEAQGAVAIVAEQYGRRVDSCHSCSQYITCHCRVGWQIL